MRRAVANDDRIAGALNNDMIGWANDHRLDNTIRYSNPGIRDIQHAAAMQFTDLITYDALYYKSTDAAAYYEAFGDIVGGIGSHPVLSNPHYHQTHDLLEFINHELVAETSKTTVGTLMLLASSPARLNDVQATAAFTEKMKHQVDERLEALYQADRTLEESRDLPRVPAQDLSELFGAKTEERVEHLEQRRGAHQGLRGG